MKLFISVFLLGLVFGGFDSEKAHRLIDLVDNVDANTDDLLTDGDDDPVIPETPCFSDVQLLSSYLESSDRGCVYEEVVGSVQSSERHELVEYIWNDLETAYVTCDQTINCQSFTYCGGNTFVLKNIVYSAGEETLVDDGNCYDFCVNVTNTHYTNPISLSTEGSHANCKTYYTVECDLADDTEVDDSDNTEYNSTDTRRALALQNRRRLRSDSQKALDTIDKLDKVISSLSKVFKGLGEIFPELKAIGGVLGAISGILSLFGIARKDPVMEKLEEISNKIDEVKDQMTEMWKDIKNSITISGCMNQYHSAEFVINQGFEYMNLATKASNTQQQASLRSQLVSHCANDRCMSAIQKIMRGFSGESHIFGCDIMNDILMKPDPSKNIGPGSLRYVAYFSGMIIQLVNKGIQVETAYRNARDGRMNEQNYKDVGYSTQFRYDQMINFVQKKLRSLNTAETVYNNIHNGWNTWMHFNGNGNQGNEQLSSSLGKWLSENWGEEYAFHVTIYNDVSGWSNHGYWHNNWGYSQGFSKFRSFGKNSIIYWVPKSARAHPNGNAIRSNLRSRSSNSPKSWADNMPAVANAYPNVYLYTSATREYNNVWVYWTTSGYWYRTFDKVGKYWQTFIAARTAWHRRRNLANPTMIDQAHSFVCAQNDEYCFCSGHVRHSADNSGTWEAVDIAVRCRGEKCFCAGEGQVRRGDKVIEMLNGVLLSPTQLVDDHCTAPILAAEKNRPEEPSSESNNEAWIVVAIVCGLFLLGCCAFIFMQKRGTEKAATDYGRF